MTGRELKIEIAKEGPQENAKSDPGHEIGFIEEGTQGQHQDLLETPQDIKGGDTTQDLTRERGKGPCLSSLEISTREEL